MVHPEEKQSQRVRYTLYWNCVRKNHPREFFKPCLDKFPLARHLR